MSLFITIHQSQSQIRADPVSVPVIVNPGSYLPLIAPSRCWHRFPVKLKKGFPFLLPVDSVFHQYRSSQSKQENFRNRLCTSKLTLAVTNFLSKKNKKKK